MTKTIVPHDLRWKQAYDAEARSLRDALGNVCIAVHHMGSTAVPGIMAKPVIDILVEARDLEGVEARTPALERLGYEARGAYGIEGRRYFVRRTAEAGITGVHVHVYASGSPELERHLLFRDTILQDPAIARAYEALKQSLVGQDGALVADYTARKAGFIDDVVAAARARRSVADTLREMYRALGDGDTARLQAIFTDDFEAYDVGRQYDGPGFAKLIADARKAGKRFVWTVGDEVVRIEGNCAWIRYINRGSVGDASGTTPVTWLESAILYREADRWRIRFFHSSRAQP